MTILSTGLDRDKENVSGYRNLAQAHGMLGEIPQADLATAEGYFYGGGYNDAKIFAMRAQQTMKRGSPGWVRAQDIINFKTQEEEMKLSPAGGDQSTARVAEKCSRFSPGIMIKCEREG